MPGNLLSILNYSKINNTLRRNSNNSDHPQPFTCQTSFYPRLSGNFLKSTSAARATGAQAAPGPSRRPRPDRSALRCNQSNLVNTETGSHSSSAQNAQGSWGWHPGNPQVAPRWTSAARGGGAPRPPPRRSPPQSRASRGVHFPFARIFA